MIPQLFPNYSRSNTLRTEGGVMAYDHMPCGNCDCGVYAQESLDNANKLFRQCQNQKEALKIAPMCKLEPKHICYGALDFIKSLDFIRLSKSPTPRTEGEV